MLELEVPGNPKNFNEEVNAVLDATISRLLGPEVREALVKILKDRYDVSPDEVPYRLETVFQVLHDELGEPGVQTVQMVTAKRLFEKFGLAYTYLDNFTLQDHVKQAKEVLASFWS
jgi:hypothetical protein